LDRQMIVSSPLQSSGEATLPEQHKEKGRDQDSHPNHPEHYENGVTAHPPA